ncbi:MAG TPA: rhomboid family intramembrane serine protease [Paludibacter sp.]|nr:rhomboid family intramembrane serine protease [Paludibacter sp.]
MSTEQNKNELKRQFFRALFIPLIIALIMVLTFVFEKGMGLNFHHGGILPRSLKNFQGIFTYIFIHADVAHLINNVLSFVVLSVSLFYFYRPIATKILLLSYFSSGIILWMIGRDSWHIGASGLIYSLAFFLFFSGLIRKHVPLIAISLIITFLYGSMVWHVFPWQTNDPISWEGHLAGGITGLILSVIYRNSGPQKPEIIWENDEEDEEVENDEYPEEIADDTTDSDNELNKRNNII